MSKIIVIGSSTGGVQTLEKLLKPLPRTVDGILIVQHMPEGFTESFAQRLDSVCKIDVKEAKDGDKVIKGQALIAPGGKYLLVKKSDQHYFAVIDDSEKEYMHKPSVDALFYSAATVAKEDTKAIILTGMGMDGAESILEIKNNGGITIAQDKESCVVFGMPKAAIELGGVDKILSLDDITKNLIKGTI